MKELISFLSSYQPLYAEVVRGYPESKIVELERTLKRPLPRAYRDFLATAAANLGFVVGDEVTFDIDEVIDLAAEKQYAMPANLCPIAVDDVQPMCDYYLDVARAPYEGDGLVVAFACGSHAFDDLHTMYPSLRDMLFTKGFRGVRMLTLPYRASVHWRLTDFEDPHRAPRRDELHGLLTRLGLRRLPVTGDASALYEGGDCAAIVYGDLALSTFMVVIAADSQERTAIVAETLCDKMSGQGIRESWSLKD